MPLHGRHFVLPKQAGQIFDLLGAADAPPFDAEAAVGAGTTGIVGIIGVGGTYVPPFDAATPAFMP